MIVQANSDQKTEEIFYYPIPLNATTNIHLFIMEK